MSVSRRFRVKICGMTRPADAHCAVEAGVDALGFIFYAKSPRNIAPKAAKSLIAELPPLVDTVGVFVNEEPGRIVTIAEDCGLGLIQLHGAETPAYCRELAKALPCCRLLKAFRIGPQTTAADIAPYSELVHGYLLDTFHKDSVGGTGQAFDWGQIKQLSLTRPILLAGGLDCTNITLALQQNAPYGVDANSGLEDAPGQKNHQKIKQFLQLVRLAEQTLLSGQQ